MPKQLIFNIQYLRGGAALAVVVYHIYVWEMKFFPGRGVMPSLSSIGDAGVDLFFAISGFIMVYIRPANITSFSGWRGFLSDRFSRIYPPYWLLSLALLPLWFLRPDMFNNYCGNQMDITRSFLLFPQEFTPLLPVGWTLIHEVYFYVIVSFSFFLQTRGRVIFGITWFLAVVLGFNSLANADGWVSPFLRMMFSPFSLTFLLGYFIGLVFPLMGKIPSVAWWSILFVALGLLILGRMQIDQVGVYPDNNLWHRFFGFGIPCSLILAAAVALQRRCAGANRALLLVGDSSYALYLVHLPIVAGIYALAAKLGSEAQWIILSAPFLCMACCLGAAVIFHKKIERHLIKISRALVRRILKS